MGGGCMFDEVVIVFLIVIEYCKWERIYSFYMVVNYNVVVVFFVVCVKYYVFLFKNSINIYYMY